MAYRNFISAFFESRWAIEPRVMQRMLPVVEKWSVGVKLDKQAVDELMDGRQRDQKPRHGNTGILYIDGILSQRMNMLQQVSEGGTSTELIGQAFDKMLSDRSISNIVAHFDTPGGGVFGIRELFTKFYNARGVKPMRACVNSLCASAGWWLASAFPEIVMTPGGQIGSQGVFLMHVDQSGFNEMTGLKPTFVHSTGSPHKVDGHPHAPLPEDVRAKLQEDVDGVYDKFVADVAKGRGVSRAKAKTDFGRGDVMDAEDARRAGMIDRIESFDATLSRVHNNPAIGSTRATSAAINADVARARRLNRRRRLGLTNQPAAVVHHEPTVGAVRRRLRELVQ